MSLRFSYSSMSTKTAVTELSGFRSTDPIQTNLKDNNDVIIARLCDFSKALYFSFKKDYVNQILSLRVAAVTN